MTIEKDNRILARIGARELTAEETEKPTGGFRLTVSTTDASDCDITTEMALDGYTRCLPN